MTRFPRRKFLKTIGGAAVATALPQVILGTQSQKPAVAVLWEPEFRSVQGCEISRETLPSSGEIDIMEHVGFDSDVVHASVHTKSYNHNINTHKTAKTRVSNARSEFNGYAIEWDAQEIRAYINQQHYFTFKNERLTNPAADYKEWPFDKPFHLLLNIAVGGTWGGQKGVDDTIWPQRMEVDYVCVYRNVL